MLIKIRDFWHFDTLQDLKDSKYEYLDHQKKCYLQMQPALTNEEAQQLAFQDYLIKIEVMQMKLKPPRDRFFSTLNAYSSPPRAKKPKLKLELPLPKRKRGRPPKRKTSDD